jgi:hypothetical protein
MSSQSRNTYLEQVVAQQAELEENLRAKRAPAPVEVSRAAAPARAQASRGTAAVDVRITGFGRWKTVLVPPNAFVVHTRRGREEPLHVGLGVSFRYNPVTDSYLVVPGAMQTILINAYCICQELQGLLVQAYVQWIIQDFGTAYRKLDFSDAEEPMRLVNLQLKEQAEATIKDKVATVSVHEVLSDKQPIIEELTARLRAVAEGDTGLGLRIVTVQIKEAVVSSARLWENLQKPYRSEQERIARLAEVDATEAISVREMAAERQRETRRLDNERDLADQSARNEARAFDREAVERVRRARREQEDARTLAEVARVRVENEYALKQQVLDGDLALDRSRVEQAHDEALLLVERERLRAAIANEQSAASIQAKLIDALPAVVAQMPTPTEVRTVTIAGNDTTSVAGLVAELSSAVGAVLAR